MVSAAVTIGTNYLNGGLEISHSSSPTIMGLAQDITKLSEDMTKYFQAEGIPAPTFKVGSDDPPATPEYRRIHAALKTALEDLSRLIDGPSKWLREFCCTGYDLGAFQVALDFGFFDLVPDEGEIAIESLAKQAGLDADRTGRVVRQLMTYRIFEEHHPRQISHSSTSFAMKKDTDLRAVVHYSLDEMLKAAADSNLCLKASPYDSHQNLNPFVTRHGVGIFEYYKQNPEKAVRFSKAMAGLRKMDNHLDFLLKNSFDWSAVHGTIVDCGGGNGHISKSLAQMYPHTSFIVQDSNADMLAEGQTTLSADLQDRIVYQKHDFFDPNPAKNASAFLIRQCTHNWADEDVVKIFRAFVPGLENSAPGTPLLINDIIIPEPNVLPRHEERKLRQVDMVMLVNCGAKQRTEAEFRGLLTRADERFEVKRVFDHGPLGLLEVYLRR